MFDTVELLKFDRRWYNKPVKGKVSNMTLVRCQYLSLSMGQMFELEIATLHEEHRLDFRVDGWGILHSIFNIYQFSVWSCFYTSVLTLFIFHYSHATAL